MLRHAFLVPALIFACSCDTSPSPSGTAAPPASGRSDSAQLSMPERLEANFSVAQRGRIGLFRMTDDMKEMLRPAHSNLVAAIRNNDEAGFRSAMLTFWSVPIRVVEARAAFARGMSHGSGGGGSSDVWAKGVNDGISIGLAGVDRAKIKNGVVCTYFYGEEYGDCGGERLFNFFNDLNSGRARISDLRSLLN